MTSCFQTLWFQLTTGYRHCIKALLTTCDLTFDPPKLDFGHVFLGETSIIRLKVTNHSLLMQQYGFVGLPKTAGPVKYFPPRHETRFKPF